MFLLGDVSRDKDVRVPHNVCVGPMVVSWCSRLGFLGMKKPINTHNKKGGDYPLKVLFCGFDHHFLVPLLGCYQATVCTKS